MFLYLILTVFCVKFVAKRDPAELVKMPTGNEESSLKSALQSQLTDPLMQGCFAKREVAIVLTDWGLGGLSILSPLFRRLTETLIFPGADLLSGGSRRRPPRNWRT